MSYSANLRLFLLAGIVFNIAHLGWNQPLVSHNITSSQRLFTMNGKPCQDIIGNAGICMFKLDCISRNGITLSTCVDGFLFGACCKFKVHSSQINYEATSNTNDIDMGEIAPENKVRPFLFQQAYNNKNYNYNINHILTDVSATPKQTNGSDLINASTSLQDLRTGQDENFLAVPVGLISTTESHAEDRNNEKEEGSAHVKFRDRNAVTESSENDNPIVSDIEKSHLNDHATDYDINLNIYNQTESLISTFEFSSELPKITNNSNFDFTLESFDDDDIPDYHESYLQADESNPEESLESMDSLADPELVSKNTVNESLSFDAFSNKSDVHFAQNINFSTEPISFTASEEDNSYISDEDNESFITSDYTDDGINIPLSNHTNAHLTDGKISISSKSNSSKHLHSSAINNDHMDTSSISECNDNCSLNTSDEENNSIDNNSPFKLKAPYTTQKLENTHNMQKPIETSYIETVSSTDINAHTEMGIFNETDILNSEAPPFLSDNEKPVSLSSLVMKNTSDVQFSGESFSDDYISNTSVKDEIAVFQTTSDFSGTNSPTSSDLVDALTNAISSLSTLKNTQLVNDKNITETSMHEVTNELYEIPDDEIKSTSHTQVLSSITSFPLTTEKSSTHFEGDENANTIETTQSVFKTVINNTEVLTDTELISFNPITVNLENHKTNISEPFPRNDSMTTTDVYNDTSTHNSSNKLSSTSQGLSSFISGHNTNFTTVIPTKMIQTVDQTFISELTSTNDFQDIVNNNYDETTNDFQDIVNNNYDETTNDFQDIVNNNYDETTNDFKDIVNNNYDETTNDFKDIVNNNYDETTNAYNQKHNVSYSKDSDPSEILTEASTVEKLNEQAAVDYEGNNSYQNSNNSSVYSSSSSSFVSDDSSADETVTLLITLSTDKDSSLQQVINFENINLTNDNLSTQGTLTNHENIHISNVFNLSTSVFTALETVSSTSEFSSGSLEQLSSTAEDITSINEQGNTTDTVLVTDTNNLTSPDVQKTTTSDFYTESTYQELTTSQLLNDGRGCGVRRLRPFGRIVGGRNTYFGKWPWQALVKEATWLGLFVKNKCGGVLITEKYVITAAHCQPGFLATLVVILGAHDLSGTMNGQIPIARNVRRMVVHRHYNPQTFENDLALLEMESPIDFLPHVVPICLPNRNEDFTGKMAFVTGWGKLTHGGDVPNILQEVQVPIVTNRDCQKMFLHAGHQKAIRSNFVCAGYRRGGQDSCEGDSGGPLVVQRDDKRWVLVGTVSHGIGCADANLPGVYMKMSAYRPWIDSIINK